MGTGGAIAWRVISSPTPPTIGAQLRGAIASRLSSAAEICTVQSSAQAAAGAGALVGVQGCLPSHPPAEMGGANSMLAGLGWAIW